MKKIYIGMLVLIGVLPCIAQGQQVEIKVNKQFINLPVSQKADRKSMQLLVDGKVDRSFVIRLSAEPEYWVFADVSAYRGKTLQINYDGNAKAALSKIYQADQIAGQDSLYKEKNRPQLHFTTKVGWTNDPNGLVYYDGEYHLFYQHNPFEREWENMHWGHAVSTDLVHWKELPTALFPDKNGTAFSGSIIIDEDNVSGLGTKEQPPMVAFYTGAQPDKQVQCIAYSLDKGLTWIKYQKNPIIDSKEKWNSTDTRDPKVFWYAPTKTWVMVLHERDGHSIYNSANLLDWTYESHITGFWECPELFSLPVDGNPAKRMWVMYGASGTYMIGKFDGKIFTPVSGKHQYVNGALYAAQTFSNLPRTDRRVIQIGWHRIDNPGMPFKSQMSLPTELKLHTTPNGIRLYSTPVNEVNSLQGKQLFTANNLSAEKANELLQPYRDNTTLRLKTTIQLSHATGAGLNLFGQSLINYDLNHNQLNGTFYAPATITAMDIEADIIIDKTSVEVFINQGHFSYCLQRQPHIGNKEGFKFWGHQINIKRLEVYEMNSIW